MRKLSKTLLSLLLIAAMLASFVVLPAAAEEPAAEQPTEAVQAAETQATDDTSYRYNIVHVDAGRKYFSPTSIKAIIDNAAEAGFNQVELYLSDNQGFRFALDDMTVTTSTGNTYDLSAALGDGYTASDGKCPDGSDKYLTQSEMTDIIAYAKSKNVEIVPCVNAPGHMGAILEEFSDFRYTSGWQTSKSSIDLGNAEAVAFALAITDKYAKYFASQGCKYYNIGADEYANDLSSMGFENMGSALYTKFVEFMNSAADIIVGHGMTPRAFNDGFCYKNYTNSVTVAPSKAYEICYWSSGWNGYNVASAKTLSSNGYKLINTNGDYYWVLGNSGWQCSANKASGFDYTNFSGNTKISSPSGSMFCIWCDFGNTNGADGGTQVVSDTADVIAAFGKALPTVRNNTATDENKTVFDSSFPGISVTGPNLTKVTVTETSAPTNLPAGVSAAMAWDIVPYVGEDEYHDTAKVTLPIPTEWTGADVYGGVIENGEVKPMSFVDVNNLFAQPNRAGYGYNTPCWTVDGMADSEYTVVVRFVKGETLAIDGFRVTNKAYESSYAQDNEAQMDTAEIRNMVIANAQTNLNFDAYSNANDMYRVTANKVLDAVFDESDVLTGAVVLTNDDTMGVNTVTVDADLLNIGPKNEIYLQPGQAVVMELTGTYASVQVGMRSLTGAAVTYQINSGEEQTMNSTVDMYYKVKLVEGKLVIQNQNVSGGILALTRLKVTSAAAASTDDPGVVPQTTPEAIRYAMALMRGLEVPQFTDVPEGAWYHDYVYDLVYRGVVNGMTATTYEPEGKLTRAQFVKLLACSLADAETLKTYEGKHPFKDSEGHWAEAYIAWAKDKGIVEGVSATEFDPEAPITREQMATIFGRYALKQGIELPKSDNAAGSFPDADKISEYAREFVELMRIAGILNGYEDGTFRPQGNATRAEAAKLFSLFLSITDKLAK